MGDTPRPLFTPGKDPIPIVQEAGWAPGPVWTGAENLTPTRIRSLDRPVRSQSLYRLRYPAHKMSRTYRHLVYADDVCLLGGNVIMVKTNTETVLVAVKDTHADVNVESLRLFLCLVS